MHLHLSEAIAPGQQGDTAAHWATLLLTTFPKLAVFTLHVQHLPVQGQSRQTDSVKFRRPFRVGRPRLASAVSVSWQVGLDFQAVGYAEAPSPTQDPSPPPPHSAATLVTDLKLAARWSPHNVTDGGPIHFLCRLFIALPVMHSEARRQRSCSHMLLTGTSAVIRRDRRTGSCFRY